MFSGKEKTVDRKSIISGYGWPVASMILVSLLCFYMYMLDDALKISKWQRQRIEELNRDPPQQTDLRTDLSMKELKAELQKKIAASPALALELEEFASGELKQNTKELREERSEIRSNSEQLAEENNRLKAEQKGLVAAKTALEKNVSDLKAKLAVEEAKVATANASIATLKKSPTKSAPNPDGFETFDGHVFSKNPESESNKLLRQWGKADDKYKELEIVFGRDHEKTKAARVERDRLDKLYEATLKKELSAKYGVTPK